MLIGIQDIKKEDKKVEERKEYKKEICIEPKKMPKDPRKELIPAIIMEHREMTDQEENIEVIIDQEVIEEEAIGDNIEVTEEIDKIEEVIEVIEAIEDIEEIVTIDHLDNKDKIKDKGIIRVDNPRMNQKDKEKKLNPNNKSIEYLSY